VLAASDAYSGIRPQAVRRWPPKRCRIICSGEPIARLIGRCRRRAVVPPGSQLQNTPVVRAADIDRSPSNPMDVAWAGPATLGAFGGFEPLDPYPARYRSVHVDYLIRATGITDVELLVARCDESLAPDGGTGPLIAADRLRQLITDAQASAPVAERAAARRV